MLNHMTDPQQTPPPPYAAVRPQQPAYAPTPNAHAPGATNPAGKIGFIIGLVSLVVSLLTSVIVQVMIRTNSYMVISTVSAIGSLIAFAASLAALILGIVGLRKPGLPHGLAGIATGLGIAGVVSGVFTFLLNTVHTLFGYF